MDAGAICQRVAAIDALLGSRGDRSEHVTKAQAAVLAKEVRKAKLSPEDLQVVLNAVSVLNAAWDFKGASGLLQECAWRSRYKTASLPISLPFRLPICLAVCVSLCLSKYICWHFG